MIQYFRGKLGYTILNASYEGYDEPEAHGRHEPDIVARDSDEILHLAEAKLGEDLSSSTTEEQFLDFSNRVMPETDIPIPFHIIVYAGDKQNLIDKLRQLGLEQKIDDRIKILTL